MLYFVVRACGGTLTSLPHAALAEAGVLPLAGAGELVEHKAVSAGAEDGDAASALVVLGAVAGVLVLEVTVHAWALNAGGLGGLCGGSEDEREDTGDRLVWRKCSHSIMVESTTRDGIERCF